MVAVMQFSKCPGGAARSAAGRMIEAARDEEGISLVLVLVIVATLTLATASLSALVISNTKAFGRDRQQARAFNVAEAGLNYAVSRLTNYDPSGSLAVNSTLGSSDIPQLFTLDGGAGNGGWWAEKTAPTMLDVYARAVSPNGTLSREVSVSATTEHVSHHLQPSVAWGYGLFVASPSGCTRSSETPPSPCPSSSSPTSAFRAQRHRRAEPERPEARHALRRRTPDDLGDATVGTASRKIISATVVGGCNGGLPRSAATRASRRSMPMATRPLRPR